MNIVVLVGARPNFIKAAPLYRALKKMPGWAIRLLHTGQHQDQEMSAVFFADLQLPAPDIQLRVQAASVTAQTAQILQKLEPELQKLKPDWLIVIGDVTSTLAGTLAAKQLGLKVAHVEAGLRSGDRSMPEELNRIAVDHLADLLLASEASGVAHLQREGIPDSRIAFVGNVLIDALVDILPKAKTIAVQTILTQAQTTSRAHLPTEFALCTFHRPSNVDGLEQLQQTIALLETVSQQLPVVLPCHPRFLQKCQQFGLFEKLNQLPQVWVLPALSYSEMIALLLAAKLVVTDSGGLQEESTYLGVPCLTFRKNTERPATLEYGTNTLIPTLEPAQLHPLLTTILTGKYRQGAIPHLWDGKAADRCVAALKTAL